ncbi:hypothetical protein ENSA5_37120 [Enhygromyxa salina]|uniref:Uncharacterized protein n=1 Tax=Enhygromyxa salina TaxID=215803 RepID=A0A2S9XSK7_9BACT|nr:hypothetical protein [Enhygromyxa salina]PRP95843.1 hypothetical protein ENSA5_37120 [Enhygromyxa salina]
MTPPSAPLEIRHRGTHFCVAACESLVVVVCGRVVDTVDLDLIAKVQRELSDEWGHFVALTIIRAGLEMTVTDEVRERSARNMREFATTTLGSALVVESGGFRAVFFRSVLTSLQLVSRSPVKQKVFSDIGEALRWLLARPGVEAKAAAAIDSLVADVITIADEYGEPPEPPDQKS